MRDGFGSLIADHCPPGFTPAREGRKAGEPASREKDDNRGRRSRLAELDVLLAKLPKMIERPRERFQASCGHDVFLPVVLH